MPQHPWPLFDLRLRTPRLEMRVPTDDDLFGLVQAAKEGVHPADFMPFGIPWTDLPSPEFERSFLRFHWSTRTGWRPDSWRLLLGAIYQGEPIGLQEVAAEDFSNMRTVRTGSWLGERFQGRGLGMEMRAAVLFFAFDRLGALAAESGAVEGNAASARISEKLGYRPNGVSFVAPRGEPVLEHRFRLTRGDWRRETVPVEVEGLEGCLDWFGV